MMRLPRSFRPALLALGLAALARTSAAQAARDDDAARLVAALLGDTPMATDLQSLTDGIGGRATGSEANLAAVEWALARFRDAGVDARKEGFQMPALWLERSAHATIRGTRVFSPRIAAAPFSAPTPAGGLTAPLVDGGHGSPEDFARLGVGARGAWVMIETEPLEDLDGLFREYAATADLEQRTAAAGLAGIVYQSSRPNNVLARHNAWGGPGNRLPIVMMERDGAARALRLLRAGRPLTLTVTLDLRTGGPYESFNVIGEIRGASKPDEVVVVGAHLDSWDLGDGALDNGANVSMLIDIARQIRRLGLRPARTIRFVLWNGEEQILIGSWRYTQAHRAELDRHVMASSYDIGTGRITGFFTGGQPEIAAATTQALAPVTGLGPFTQIDVPIVGTDNFDFMMEGVATLVANQESANYGPNYHARSDTYDKADLDQLRLNAAIAATVTWWYANAPVTWTRRTRADIERLMAETDLDDQMKAFNVWADWEAGRRGRQP
jgi:hypothetical protein